jgi:hypothetical protein
LNRALSSTFPSSGIGTAIGARTGMEGKAEE